jgi:hypothetical protein
MTPSEVLLITLALATTTACAAGSQSLTGPEGLTGVDLEQEYSLAQEQVQVDLDILSEVSVFEVGELVIAQNMVPGNCYGGVCENDDDRERNYIDQADRLHALVDLATDDPETTVTPCYTTVDDPNIIASNLQAVDDLEIVDVGEFLEQEVEPSASCYNLPCPDDIAAADAENYRRAQVLHHMAESSYGL